MSASWFGIALPGVVALADMAPALLRHARRVEPGTVWQFRRPGDVEVWFHAGPDTQDELRHRILEQTRRHGWPTRPLAGQPVHDDLSTPASEFVLALLTGGHPEPDPLTASMVHLAYVAERVEAAHRSAFLHACWLTWSAGPDHKRRLELAGLAEKYAEDLPDRRGELLHSSAAHVWRAYAAALAAIDADRYALFRHATLTHARLGLPDQTAAIAALALRTALA